MANEVDLGPNERRCRGRANMAGKQVLCTQRDQCERHLQIARDEQKKRERYIPIMDIGFIGSSRCHYLIARGAA